MKLPRAYLQQQPLGASIEGLTGRLVELRKTILPEQDDVVTAV